jgi:8-amino-7-oxononanoate synthase
MAQSKRIEQRIRAFGDAKRLMDHGLYQYFRALASEQDTQVVLDGRTLLMFGSNSYLGLTNHPKVKEASARALAKYGTGCAGSRFLNGTLDIHVECEEKLAAFVGKPAALLFSTGFQVNQGVISTLVGRGDYVVLDKLDHASIVDGARLSHGTTRRFRHNDMVSLRKILAGIPSDAGRLVVADGVFSMDGDIIDLPALLDLAEQYDAMVMIDDAHGIGVLGNAGRGTVDHFKATDRVDLIMGTFSKALASQGGFVAGDEDTIHYLKHNSRALIFSASPTPAGVAAVIAALDIVQAEPDRLRQLWANTKRLSSGLKSMGFDLGQSATPILPVMIGDDLRCLQMSVGLQEGGVFVNPVVYPGVEPGHALLRVSVMATHSFAEIDRALEEFDRVGRQVGVLSAADEIQVGRARTVSAPAADARNSAC